MKNKNKKVSNLISQNEINELCNIDNQSSIEFVEAEKVVTGENPICHDGAEIQINRAVLDEEFPEANTENATEPDIVNLHREETTTTSNIDPGEISSSDDEDTTGR